MELLDSCMTLRVFGGCVFDDKDARRVPLNQPLELGKALSILIATRLFQTPIDQLAPSFKDHPPEASSSSMNGEHYCRLVVQLHMLLRAAFPRRLIMLERNSSF